MDKVYRALAIAGVCVVFLIGMAQRIGLPLGGPGGTLGPVTMKEKRPNEAEVAMRQQEVAQSVKDLLSSGALSCQQQNTKAFDTIEHIVQEQHQKEREEAQRKDAAETRKQYFQMVFTIVLTVLGILLYPRLPKFRPITVAIVTAALAFWLKG